MAIGARQEHSGVHSGPAVRVGAIEAHQPDFTIVTLAQPDPPQMSQRGYVRDSEVLLTLPLPPHCRHIKDG